MLAGIGAAIWYTVRKTNSMNEKRNHRGSKDSRERDSRREIERMGKKIDALNSKFAGFKVPGNSSN